MNILGAIFSVLFIAFAVLFYFWWFTGSQQALSIADRIAESIRRLLGFSFNESKTQSRENPQPETNPNKNWKLESSFQYLYSLAKANPGHPFGQGKCATAVREALQAGGLTILKFGSGDAKDYGPRLVKAGFVAQEDSGPPYLKGDIAVIEGFDATAAEGIKKAHLAGHIALFDGTKWLSDYVQPGISPYPGTDYEKAKPRIVIYRFRSDATQ